MLPSPPVDAGDDEETLAGPHEPEAARLALDERALFGLLEPSAELGVGAGELIDGRPLARHLGPRFAVGADGVDVPEGDDAEHERPHPAKRQG
jgi:hypothetical protein